MDPHEWSTSDCFAPVISMVKMRFMVSLVVQHKCALCSGDVKKAFCQAVLPHDKKCVLLPSPWNAHQLKLVTETYSALS